MPKLKIDYNLVRLEHSKGLNDAQIARSLGYVHATVNRARRKMGLVCYEPAINEPVILTTEEKEYLVGTLLGDASLYTTIYNKYTGKIEHSIKQKEYVFYKREKLGRLLTSKNCNSERLVKKRKEHHSDITKSISLIFKSNSELKYFYDLFYSSGKKDIKSDVLQYVTPKALAFWYMDDGSCARSMCILSTQSFSKNGVEILVKHLVDNYGITCHRNNSNEIYISIKTRQKFFDLIKPYIHWSMQYKLDPLMTVKDQLEFNKLQNI